MSLSESQQTDPDSETRDQTFNKLQRTAKSTEDEKENNKLMMLIIDYSETRGQTFNKLQRTAKSTEDEKDNNKLMIVNHRLQ